MDDALRWLADVDPNEIVDIFQKLGQEIFEDDLTCTAVPSREEFPSRESETEVVGTPAEQLESIKELIRFDHIYHKNLNGDDHKRVEINENSMNINDLTSQINVPCISVIDTPALENQSCEISTNQNLKTKEKFHMVDDEDVVVVYSAVNSTPSNSLKSNTRKMNLRKRTISITATPTKKSNALTKQDDSNTSELITKSNLDCLSDSGYESSGSSMRSPFNDTSSDMIGGPEDLLWDKSLVELFPTFMC